MDAKKELPAKIKEICDEDDVETRNGQASRYFNHPLKCQPATSGTDRDVANLIKVRHLTVLDVAKKRRAKQPSLFDWKASSGQLGVKRQLSPL